MKPNSSVMSRMIGAARRYAASERSDPFAFVRSTTHIRCGVAAAGDYDAKPYTFERPIPGIGKVPTVGWQSVTRA